MTLRQAHIRRAACLLGAAAAAVSSPAHAVTGRQLLKQCESLERGAVVSGDTVRLPKGREAFACWFYMAAVQDMAATTVRAGAPSLVGACPPADATRMRIVRAFTAYARAHPDDLDARATVVLVPALDAAFPCPAAEQAE